MMVYLKGDLVVKNPAYVWMEVNGIGYEVSISLHTYAAIQHLEQTQLYTYLQIKEDSHALYGFFDTDERNLFIQLISVSGIGASTARMMLSGMKPDEIRQAIQQEDEARLGKIKGIGPKSAKRLILELKDKMLKSGHSSDASYYNKQQEDALLALMNLGITRQPARQAVEKVLQSEPDASVETIIKKALQNI